MQERHFDLNIEKVLENWSIAHAIREVIANALDEQIITKTEDIEIFCDGQGAWHIRDFGRGLQYIHLTQNENEEKLNHPNLIGKFGVGLKDALATFDRHNVEVTIDSKYGHFTIGKSVKHGFSDIITLHAYISDPIDINFAGTEFVLRGCTADDILEAKRFFLKFSNLHLFETTDYGEIYSTRENKADIFINGIKVAEEDNFLFSYNITSLNASLRKALNRERTNVGRSAYSDRVRLILLNAHSEDVIDAFTQNLTQMNSGTQCDEMKWVDVQSHAVKLLHSRKDTVFVTPKEIETSGGAVREVISDSGKKPVYIPETVKKKIEGELDSKGNKISTITTIIEDYNKSFVYDFIPYEKLKKQEQRIFDLVVPTLDLLQSKFCSDSIYISEKLRADTSDATVGVYERENKRIIILRKQLSSKELFLGTLIHELVHADSGWPDCSRLFECELTKIIGLFAAKIIKNKSQKMNAVKINRDSN